MTTTMAAGTRPQAEYAAPSWRRRGEADRTLLREEEEGARAPPSRAPYVPGQGQPDPPPSSGPLARGPSLAIRPMNSASGL